MKKEKQITQYFSKWRNRWVDFSDNFGNKRTPNQQEINEFSKFKYKLR